MTTPRRRAAALLLLLSAAACQRVHSVAPRNLETLTQEQILDNHFTNAYDAVASLRAKWLVVRGTDSFTTPSEVWVYYDETKLGGVETLRNVTVNQIAYMQHYNGLDATARWGVGHSAGVIYISSSQR